MQESDHAKHEKWKQSFWLSFHALRRHWGWWVTTILGSAGVGLYQGGGGVIPGFILWLLAISGIVIACFKALHEERNRTAVAIAGQDNARGELLDYMKRRQTEQDDRRSRTFYKSTDEIAKNSTSLQALQVALATEQDLENSDIVFVCNHLVSHGHQHPFEIIKDLTPETQYIDLLLLIRSSGQRVRDQNDLLEFAYRHPLSAPLMIGKAP